MVQGLHNHTRLARSSELATTSENFPKTILKRAKEIGYRYPIDTLLIPYARGTNYSDSNQNKKGVGSPAAAGTSTLSQEEQEKRFAQLRAKNKKDNAEFEQRMKDRAEKAER